MRALGKLKKEEGIWMHEAPMPKMGDNELLVKIIKTAICGSDIHIYNWDAWAQKSVPIPLVTGHEFVGEVVEKGSKVINFKIGDRVSGEGHLVCGVCRNCREGFSHRCIHTRGIGINHPGCFAEYLALPASNAILVPDAISDDVAAIFDPLGNAVHTALSFDLIGEDVLITGAGPIGLMASSIARFAGARTVVITDINPGRLQKAEEMGATAAVNVATENLSSVKEKLGIKEGFGVGLEMSGSPQALNTLVHELNNGGKIALLGILPDKAGIDWTDFIFKSLFLKGIYGREMYGTWHKMIAMLESGLNVDPIITHVFAARDFQKGFDAMRRGESCKVILDWTQ